MTTNSAAVGAVDAAAEAILWSHPETKIVAHSVYDGGPELPTWQGTHQRWILSELNTWRTASKNSASSRAVPFPKQVQRILDDLAFPEIWGGEQKGMQPAEEIEHVEDYVDFDGDQKVIRPGAKTLWREASEEAIEIARRLAKLGLHKSYVNRLLEPFMWHTVVITATAYENFFAQRISPLAQAEIRVLAENMQTVLDASTPETLEGHWWHVPYTNTEDWRWAIGEARGDENRAWMLLCQISAARCARVSYFTQEGVRDVAEDIKLYERLTSARPPHWSPLEHVATPWSVNRQSFSSEWDLEFVDLEGSSQVVSTEHLPRVGNLLGWRSLRTTVETMLGEVTYR